MKKQFMTPRKLAGPLLALVSLLHSALTLSQAIPKPDAAFKTSLKLENIDQETYRESVDGKEQKVTGRDEKSVQPQWVLWADKNIPGNNGVYYGISKKLGWRHLRIGFLQPVAVGSILVEGGGILSVLKPGAPYPGNLNDDSQWIPAQRLLNGKPTTKEVGFEEYGVWVLPPGTNTRAIRFSHQPEASDLKYEGWLGGVTLAADRLANLADVAQVSSKTNSQMAKKLTNGLSDRYATWETVDARQLPIASDPVISMQNPEWILLNWSQPVKISSLAVLWSGFSKATVQTYIGPANQHPRDARESQWQNVADYTGMASGYPKFWPNLLDLHGVVTTRALRLKIIGPLVEPGNVMERTHNGTRTWLGEIMALQSLGTTPLQPAIAAPPLQITANAPIAIPFKLKEPGYVTLVIENKNGVRVRNLISETWFKAGDNVAYWDGLDDLGRDIDAMHHGVYKIPAKFVDPGDYHVHGLVRGEISTTYEFSVYTTGTPPWTTDDHTGGWLANHSPPQAAVFVPAKQSPSGKPAVYLGCFVTEGPEGLAWVDLDGNKLGGKKWIGGNWTAAPYLARDAGANADPDQYAYVGSFWETDKQSGQGELRITGLNAGTDRNILTYNLGAFDSKNGDRAAEMHGLSVNNGIAVASLTKKNKLMFVDVKAGKVLGTTNVDEPLGSAFTAKGELLVISGKKLLKFASLQNIENISAPKTLISTNLEAPIGITLDTEGNIYISDGGQSHQVKVFTANGKLIKAIGKPGAPEAGPYDELHMHNPAGITIDSRQQLWVAENDFVPKRVSVWTLDGKFVKAFYGPGKYGGGGEVDAHDKANYYYADEDRGAMEFKLDWKAGTYKLSDVYYRNQPDKFKMSFRSAAPETALYHDGKRYWTNCYNSSPTSGHTAAFLFVDRNGVALPVAGMGSANLWDVLKTDAFKSRWPVGVDLNDRGTKSNSFFIWTDKNKDGQVQPEEVVIQQGASNGVTVMPDLSFCIARLSDNAVRFAPVNISADGYPEYALNKPEVLAKGTLPAASSGGSQVLTAPNGWTIVTLGMQPFDKYSISGAQNGVAKWSYPDVWPGLHASHEAPLPEQAGELIGTTRLLGGIMDNKGSESGPLWAVNSNHGMVYIFTSDGLFVATLFNPMRTGKRWSMPIAERGMDLKDITLSEENFWPTISQTDDGSVYMGDGGRNSIVKVDGLKNIHRLPGMDIKVTKNDLDKSREYLVKTESMRQQSQGSGVLNVALNTKQITVDGKLSDWTGAGWVDIDKRGVKANFNANTKPYNVTASVAVTGDRLYVAYRTGEPELLKNTGEMPIALFKTGGALDLMIGADGTAAPDRSKPVAGDSRLLVTLVKGKPKALLYQAVVSNTKQSDKVPFSSPWRTITFDKVEDVTSQLQFGGNDGDYEISLPLATFGLKPKAGLTIKGDVGILRGDGAQTFSRNYWSNKATGIVSDVPAEAELTPALWGKFEFQQ